jgi:hypothetical protein
MSGVARASALSEFNVNCVESSKVNTGTNLCVFGVSTGMDSISHSTSLYFPLY